MENFVKLQLEILGSCGVLNTVFIYDSNITNKFYDMHYVKYQACARRKTRRKFRVVILMTSRDLMIPHEIRKRW